MREQNGIKFRCIFNADDKHATRILSPVPPQVPYVKVAPEDILKVQVPRFTTLDLRPTNTDISLAVAGLLTFFNSTTSCLICAQADCKYRVRTFTTSFAMFRTWAVHTQHPLFICQQSANVFV